MKTIGAELVILKNRLVRLGLWKSVRALDHASKTYGWEAAEASIAPTRTDIKVAKAHHEKHGDMDGATCLLGACALHYPKRRKP